MLCFMTRLKDNSILDYLGCLFVFFSQRKSHGADLVCLFIYLDFLNSIFCHTGI